MNSVCTIFHVNPSCNSCYIPVWRTINVLFGGLLWRCQVCSSRQQSITVVGQWLKRLKPTHSVFAAHEINTTMELCELHSDIWCRASSVLHSASFNFPLQVQNKRPSGFNNQTFSDKWFWWWEAITERVVAGEVKHLFISWMFSIIQLPDCKVFDPLPRASNLVISVSSEDHLYLRPASVAFLKSVWRYYYPSFPCSSSSLA